MQTSQKHSLSLFLERLLLRSALTAHEQQAILALTGDRDGFAAHEDIVSPGETVESSCLVAQGLVARYDQMRNGERQVTSYYIAGDMCDLHSVVVPKATWSITAVSQADIIRVPHRQLRDLCSAYPSIALAFWRDGTVDAAVLAKWVGNLGRKSAKARIAHLICEMGMRMEAAHQGTRMSFEFRATQQQLSDASGLTPVHVNRTLGAIRAAGLLKFSGGHVEVTDWQGLTSIAEFDPAYLMLAGPPERPLAAVNSHPASGVQ